MKAPLTALLFGLLTTAAIAAPQPSGKNTAALETLLACRPGSDFTQDQATQALQAAGLTPLRGGIFEVQTGKVTLFGGNVDSADVSIAPGGNKSLHVYLKDVTAEQVGRHLSVTTVNDAAETEAPSYLRKVDARHTLHVGAADDYEGYSASVTCQITR